MHKFTVTVEYKKADGGKQYVQRIVEAPDWAEAIQSVLDTVEASVVTYAASKLLETDLK